MTDQGANDEGEVGKLYERFGELWKAKTDEREDLFTANEIVILENLGKQSQLVQIDFQNKWKVLSRSRTEAEEDQAKGKFKCESDIKGIVSYLNHLRDISTPTLFY